MASVEQVKVRRFPTAEHGTWFAVINTGMDPVDAVTISLPEQGSPVDAVTDEPIVLTGSTWTVDLYPGEVRTIHIAALNSPPAEEPDAGTEMNPESPDSGMTTSDAAVDGGQDATGDAADPSSDSGGCDCDVNETGGIPIWLPLILLALFRRRHA